MFQVYPLIALILLGTRERRQFVLALSFSVERSMKCKTTGCVLERFGTHLHVFTRHVCSYRLRFDKSRFDSSSFNSARIHHYDFTALLWKKQEVVLHRIFESVTLRLSERWLSCLFSLVKDFRFRPALVPTSSSSLLLSYSLLSTSLQGTVPSN